jgi:propanol-preferring alcohol dehydrogenase
MYNSDTYLNNDTYIDIPRTMRAMVLERPKEPLKFKVLPIPSPDPKEVLIKVHACGVCRTDLHIFDGELPNPKLPLILGHEIVGTVVQVGQRAGRFRPGVRVGVPWLGYTDGTCGYCRSGHENLCDNPKFTGYTRDGGYSEYAVADHRYCFPVPEAYTDLEAAPLLCAGLIGYRSYRIATLGGNIERLGIYGFGAAAHILTQLAANRGIEVYAFTRPGDTKGQEFACHMGALWSGGSNEHPPQFLDAAIIFAPVGSLVPAALKVTAKGGVVVCGGIHMSDIPSFPYAILWDERVVRSVANLTRQDGDEFLKLAAEVPVKTQIAPFPLEKANHALESLREGKIEGAAVLFI